jgi:hypothetical protein
LKDSTKDNRKDRTGTGNTKAASEETAQVLDMDVRGERI